jgi:hypothetical protein
MMMRCTRTKFVVFALCLLLGLMPQADRALAQNKMSPEDEAIYRNMMKSVGVDPGAASEAARSNAAARPWTDGKNGIVDYHIVGVYQGRTNVSGDSNWIAYADVTDSVTIDLKWKLAESMLLGTPTFQNAKSGVTNPRNPEPKCSPPVIKGEYEHYEIQGIKQGLGGALELQVKTAYPVVDVAQFCTGARKTIPASSKVHPEEMVVPSPVMLGMSLPDSDTLRISADRKSLIQKKGGWTWTFTPAPGK